MTELNYLKCKLEDTEKAFDRLHKKYMELLKQQGELEEENELLKDDVEMYKNTIENYTRLVKETSEENEQLKQQLQVCLEHHNCILETEKICVMCDECANLSMDYTNSIGGIL